MLRLVPVIVLAVTVSLASAGDEPWSRHTVDDSSRGADGVRLADVNGDGWLDIATGWEEGGRVRVYLNPGPAKAKKAWPAVTVGNVKSPEDAVFVDLDGDGATDVISCCEGRTRTIYVHWAPREPERYLEPTAWETEILPHSEGFAMWMFCEPMQVDGRRGIDLVVGSKNTKEAGVGWYESPENPRDLAAWSWHPIVEAGWIMSLRRIDFDRDGRDDLLFSDRKGSRRGVWLASPSRTDDGVTWKVSPLGGRDREVMFLATGEINTRPIPIGSTANERRPDIVVAVKGSGLLQLQSKGDEVSELAFDPPTVENTGTGKGAAIADVNLDGRTDVLFTCENAKGTHGVMWLEQPAPDGGRTDWQPHAISGTEPGIKFDRIEMLDLDDDGDLDLLTCEERDNLGVIWYENPTR